MLNDRPEPMWPCPLRGEKDPSPKVRMRERAAVKSLVMVLFFMMPPLIEGTLLLPFSPTTGLGRHKTAELFDIEGLDVSSNGGDGEGTLSAFIGVLFAASLAVLLSLPPCEGVIARCLSLTAG